MDNNSYHIIEIWELNFDHMKGIYLLNSINIKEKINYINKMHKKYKIIYNLDLESKEINKKLNRIISIILNYINNRRKLIIKNSFN